MGEAREQGWETDGPAAFVTVRWGDTTLYAEHLAPPRSLWMGGAGADVVLPEAAIGGDRAPLLIAEGDRLWLVLLPGMDGEGTIAVPGRPDRAVGDLARPGMAGACPGVPGAFRVELPEGSRATLAIGDFSIAIAVGKAARAVAGHFHTSKRMIPFHAGAAVLHLGILGALATFVPPFIDDGEVSQEQILYMREALLAVAEKQEDFDGTPADGYAVYYSGAPTISREDLMASFSEMPRSRRALPKRGGEIDSYAAVRQALRGGELPPADLVKTAAIVDAIDDGDDRDAPSAGGRPFAVGFAAAPSPFTAGRHLILVQVRPGAAARDPWATAGVEAVVEMDPRAVTSFRHLGDESLDGHDFPPGADIAKRRGVNAVYEVILACTACSPVTVKIHRETARGDVVGPEASYRMPPSAIAPSFASAPASFRRAVAAAGLGEILRGDDRAAAWRLADVERIARGAAESSTAALELVDLARAARALDDAPPSRSAWTGAVGNASLMQF
jgi:hypothetical protein